MDLKQFFSGPVAGQATNLITGVGGYLTEQRGYSLAQAAYQTAASSTRAVANYENEIADYNLALDTAYRARQADRLMSAQRAQAAASGFAVGSKTNLLMMAETLTNLERETRQARTAVDAQKSMTSYAGELSAYNNEVNRINQQYLAKQAKTKSITNLTGQLGSLFGAIGGL